MSVKTYSLKKDGNTFLSDHFQVKEFACKDGSDKILINSDLITILEKLFSHLNCKAINITSGYRTPSHSVAVGGYSTDQHTKGNAADITCKKQDGSLFSSNEICCALEDLNHQGGVGRINKTYSVHVDVRGYKCWFDETNYEKTCSSWYTYLGIKKPSSSTSSSSSSSSAIRDTESVIHSKGIDVSTFQGKDIDFNKVVKDGISFVILRAGYGKYINQKDDTFEINYKKAREAGLKVGCYWYSYATDVAGAKAEVETFLEAVKGKVFEMPIFYDVEESATLAKGKTVVSSIISTFLSATEAAGYYSGIYMSSSALMSYVEDAVQRKYTLWVAHHDVSKCGYSGAGVVHMWQYTAKGTVSGISGNVDMNYCYEDYFTKIKSKGLNGYGDIIKGDVNRDGKVTAADAREVMRYVSGLESFTEDQKVAADFDGDGDVDLQDARKTLRDVAGIE